MDEEHGALIFLELAVFFVEADFFQLETETAPDFEPEISGLVFDLKRVVLLTVVVVILDIVFEGEFKAFNSLQSQGDIGAG